MSLSILSFQYGVNVISDVELFSKKRPRDVLKNLHDYLRVTVEADPTLRSEEPFLDVCTVEKEDK